MLAVLASTGMRRVMIQAEEDLLRRARELARRRGISFPQLVRNALARELGLSASRGGPGSIGAIDSGGAGARRDYRPDPWR